MRSCYMKNKTATELYLKAWVFLVIQESSNIENIFHYQSFFSSRFVDKNNCSFPLRSFPCSLLFFAAVAGGCVGYPSTNWLSLRPPALCSLLLARFYSACTKMTLFFFFFFLQGDSSASLDLSQHPLLEQLLLSFTLQSMMEGFHYTEHLIFKHSFDHCCLWDMWLRKGVDKSFCYLSPLLFSRQLNFQ